MVFSCISLVLYYLASYVVNALSVIVIIVVTNSLFINMDIILIATILSPIIAVIIAIWTSNSSAKETARQIAALEESTNRQIDSMKQLAKIQIETTSLILDKELWEAKQMNHQIQQKCLDNTDDRFAMMGIPYNAIVARMQDRNEKKRDLEYEQEFFDKQVRFLNSSIQRLEKIKKELAIS